MTRPVPDLASGLLPRSKSRRRLLGQMLLDRGLIDHRQLDEVLLRQKTERGSRVGRLLVDQGYVSEALICEVIADQLNSPRPTWPRSTPQDVLSRVPRERGGTPPAGSWTGAISI
jgi:hypothetical protein